MFGGFADVGLARLKGGGCGSVEVYCETPVEDVGCEAIWILR